MDKLNYIKYALEQIIEKGNLDVITSSFSENYIAHSGARIHRGHSFIRKFTNQIRTALPDIKILRVELLSETENTLTCQRSFSGTHTEKLKGIPPSNKKVKLYEIVETHFENEKIAEEWVVSDLAAQLMLKLK